jgi:hypothetical protein
MATGKEIKRLRGKDVTASKAAKLIGVGVDRLRKWEERDSDPSDTGDIAKVEAYFGRKLDALHEIKAFDFVELKPPLDPVVGQDLSMQAIHNLTQSGIKLANAQEIMATNEARLISLLERKSTVGDQKDNDVASAPVMSALLVAMAKIASGSHDWGSEKEALRELGRLIDEQVYGSKKGEGIQIDGGRQHTGK